MIELNEIEVIHSDAVVLSVSDRINIIHSEMTGHMTMAVKKAIEVGRLLTEQKEQLAHGEWIPWVKSNIIFGETMARNYMRVYSNRQRVADLQSSSLRETISLLAEPKESIEPQEEKEPEVIYKDNPEQIKRANAAESAKMEAERRLSIAQDEVRRKEKELEGLRKLEADKVKIEKTLKELHELEKRKQELFADAESTKLVQGVLVRSREFFTRECMQIPALKLRPESVRVMKQDFEGLIELVDNWLEAMKGRFL